MLHARAVNGITLSTFTEYGLLIGLTNHTGGNTHPLNSHVFLKGLQKRTPEH